MNDQPGCSKKGEKIVKQQSIVVGGKDARGGVLPRKKLKPKKKKEHKKQHKKKKKTKQKNTLRK